MTSAPRRESTSSASSGRLRRVWAQYRRRVRGEGFWRTITYVLGNVVLARVGLEVRLVYASAQSDPQLVASDSPFDRVTSMEQLSPADLDRLEAFEGSTLVRFFSEKLAEGSWCAVVRDDTKTLASVCWVSPAPPHLVANGERAVLIHDCFTLPSLRGRGMYPIVLRALRNDLLGGPAPAVDTVLVNCVFSNWASERGIVKAGFGRSGSLTRIWGLKIAHRRTRSGRILRRF
jgi:hypothetical protein